MSPAALKYREEMLKKRAEKVTALGDLSRALLLPGWQVGDMQAPNVAPIDQKVQKDLADRFVKKVRETLNTADAAKRIAAAVLVGEMADEARRTRRTSQVMDAMLAELVKDLDAATKDKDQELREAVARSLSKIGANPETIVPALQRLLTDQKEAVRRAAAEALGNLARSAVRVDPMFPGQFPVPGHEIRTYGAIVPAAGQGLADTDPEVRRACAEAIRHCATKLPDFVPEMQHFQLPPPGQQLTQNEIQEIKALQQQIAQHRRVIQPLVKALNDQEALLFALRVSEPAVPKQLPGPVPGRPLEKALRVFDPAVCLAAVQSLEGMANTRRRLLQWTASMPYTSDKNEDTKLEDTLLQMLSKAKGNLVILLGKEDGDIRIRLAALYVFEALGKDTDAKAVGPHIISALDDKNPFIRWGAIRALGEMAPDLAEKIVPGLAKRLTDKNADVRRSAASALRRYGPKAKAAVGDLRAAIQHDDPATRLSAVQVLAAVGKEAGKDAISWLVKSLTDEHKEVRVEAARALSKFGPHAPDGDAAKALRKALKDPDAQVRLAASEALLR
jgi:HEAT repeat protein